MDMEQEPAPQAYVGIDWATVENEVCVVDSKGEVRAQKSFRNDGDGLQAMGAWLLTKAATVASRIWVAIEVPHGPVVETLLELGFVVHTINPKQLDRFRDRFSLAGAKDDRLDARVLADSLRTDAHAFRRLRVADPTLIELREWSRIHDELQEEKNRLTNRIREQLRRYYPQMLAVDDDPGANWMLDLFKLAPTPEQAKRRQRASYARILRKNRIRRLDADQVRELLRQQSVTVAPGTEEAATAHIEQLAARVRLVNAQIKDADRRLDVLLGAMQRSTPGPAEPSGSDEESSPGERLEQHDAAILRSLPGVGRVVLAVLLAEATEPVAARDYHALRTLSGIAPVTQQSGRSKVVIMRRACHPRLREALHHWARSATQNDPRSKRRYAELRARGHSHGRALRSIGDALLRTACAMLREGTHFDPNRQNSRVLAA